MIRDKKNSSPASQDGRSDLLRGGLQKWIEKKQKDGPPNDGRNCLDDTTIVGFASHAFSASRAKEIIEHLVSCMVCYSKVESAQAVLKDWDEHLQISSFRRRLLEMDLGTPTETTKEEATDNYIFPVHDDSTALEVAPKSQPSWAIIDAAELELAGRLKAYESERAIFMAESLGGLGDEPTAELKEGGIKIQKTTYVKVPTTQWEGVFLTLPSKEDFPEEYKDLNTIIDNLTKNPVSFRAGGLWMKGDQWGGTIDLAENCLTEDYLFPDTAIFASLPEDCTLVVIFFAAQENAESLSKVIDEVRKAAQQGGQAEELLEASSIFSIYYFIDKK